MSDAVRIGVDVDDDVSGGVLVDNAIRSGLSSDGAPSFFAKF